MFISTFELQKEPADSLAGIDPMMQKYMAMVQQQKQTEQVKK